MTLAGDMERLIEDGIAAHGGTEVRRQRGGSDVKLLIIDHKARSTRGMSINQAARADVIVGKDRTVLKDQQGITLKGRSLTVKELDALRAEAEEVIERGEALV